MSIKTVSKERVVVETEKILVCDFCGAEADDIKLTTGWALINKRLETQKFLGVYACGECLNLLGDVVTSIPEWGYTPKTVGSMNALQRYTPTKEWDSAVMVEDDIGEYVKLNDVNEFIKRLHQQARHQKDCTDANWKALCEPWNE